MAAATNGFILLSLYLFLASASAGLDPAACDGKGACLEIGPCNGITGSSTCGDAGSFRAIERAMLRDLLPSTSISDAYVEIVPEDEFPIECDTRFPPEPDMVLMKWTTGANLAIEIFAFVDYNCDSEDAIESCSRWDNPGNFSL